MEDVPEPRTALEIAGAIAAFAKSLSDDPALICECLRIAREAIESDYLAAGRRGSRSDPAARL
jgi:hypothetical protein